MKDFPDFGGSKWPEYATQKSAHVIHGSIRRDVDPRFKGEPFVKDKRHYRESQDHSYIENDIANTTRNPLTGVYERNKTHTRAGPSGSREHVETSHEFVARQNASIPVMNSLGTLRQRLPGDREN